MVVFEDALNIVLSQEVATAHEHVALSGTLGRILAEDIFSDMDMPPFDKSAVDGYACRIENIVINDIFKIIETIPAGSVPQHTLLPGQCSKIMTGGMVPPGADGVVMVEDTEQTGDGWVKFLRNSSAKNICYRGEDIRKGDVVLNKGLRITPAHIAVLASVGAVMPLVAKLPHTGIISTGDELVEPHIAPGLAQIRNSNGWQLEAQLRSVPVLTSNYGIVADEGPVLRNTIGNALAENDVVLLTGGVSMGEFDFVPAILEEAGVKILFKSVAVQPGKPTVFGRRGNTFVFGLPGNPVSAFVIFEMLVRPFLFRMMGHDFKPVILQIRMGVDFSRRKSARKSMVPVVISEGKAYPLEYHGSAHINAYTLAGGILMIETGTTEIRKGDAVNVRLL